MIVGEKSKVRGLAIEAGQSRNKIMYTAEELGNGSSTLAGVTIIKDHEATTDNSIGMVERQSFKGGQQRYEGWVEEDGTNVVQKIRDKRLKVSVGAMVKQLVREKEDDEFLVAKGIHYMELSTTPTPGVATANIETDEGKISDVVECFDMKQLQSSLTETEIASILEIYKIGESDKNNRGDSTMAEDTQTPPTDAPAAKPADVPADKPADKPVDAPDAPADKPADAPADAPADEPADAPEGEKKVEPAGEKTTNVKVTLEGLGDVKKVAEDNVSLTKENDVLKGKVQEMEKMLGATKGKVDNGNTNENVVVTDHYGCETSKSGKMSLFMMPNSDGSFPIKRGD